MTVTLKFQPSSPATCFFEICKPTFSFEILKTGDMNICHPKLTAKAWTGEGILRGWELLEES